MIKAEASAAAKQPKSGPDRWAGQAGRYRVLTRDLNNELCRNQRRILVVKLTTG
jgi:hypothetical protein